jgi:hypothetical protein
VKVRLELDVLTEELPELCVRAVHGRIDVDDARPQHLATAEGE